MKISHGVLSLAVVGCLAGCGSGGPGGSVDFNALHAQYTSPTGTLTGATDVKSVASQYSTNQKTGSGIPLGTQSVRPAAAGSLRAQNLTGSFSVSCPGGGSMSVADATSSASGEQASIDYSNCVYTSGALTDTINGTMSFADYTSPPMEIFSGTLTVRLDPPGTTENVNLNFALVDGVMKFSVTVGDGTILVSENGSWDATTDSGTLSIQDRVTTWTCTLESGKGTCVSTGHRTIKV